MQTYRILIFITFLFLQFSSYSQLKVSSNGDVELKGSYSNGGLKVGVIDYSQFSIPAIYPNTINYGGLGSASNYFHIGYVHHLFSDSYDDWPSDERLNENIIGIDNALVKIKRLNPVQYDIKESFYEDLTDEAKEQNIKLSKGKLGFIAQELLEVLPSLVHTEPTTGYYSINTFQIIPVLVKAMQEQQTIIEQLQEDIKMIEEYYSRQSINLNTSLIENVEINSNLTKAKLYQNKPNPFSVETKIKCLIPEKATRSKLYIYSMQGLQVEEVQIYGTGSQIITINAYRFKPGMYFYSLIVDDRKIDTKKMLLTN